MANALQLLSDFDLMSGAFALAMFAVGVAVALLLILGLVVWRRGGEFGVGSMLWRAALLVIGAVLAWELIDRTLMQEQAAERRAIEQRAAELAARAVAPGSALACLDAVASAPVEAACEKLLFASPETVAAAVAYVDARFSLLVAASKLAERDPDYAPWVQRLRRGIEADRYGVVAHVLTTRGCHSADCADLRLLSDTRRVLANMKARAFDSHVAVHAANWQAVAGAAVGSTPASAGPTTSSVALPNAMPMVPPTSPPSLPPGFGAVAAGAASGAPGQAPFDYPSASSIPPISIMEAEPASPPSTQASPQPRRAPAQPARRQTQTVREPAAQPATPPLSVVPPVQAPSSAQTSGSR